MALRSPVLFHNFWGTANAAGVPWVSGQLPNEGAPPTNTSPNVQIGDFAYVAGVAPDTGTFYICTNAGDPVLGGAVWVALSTGGGGADADRFAPKYLVGGPNDTAAALSGTGGFWFFPDTGDGAGIEAALQQAANVLPGDVYIRPGTFDLTGVTALPLVVPPGVRLVGAGDSLGGTRIQYTVPSSSAGTAFRLSDGAELRDIAIVATDDSDATGSGVVEIGQLQAPASAHCERVSVNLTRATTSTSNLRTAFFCADVSNLTQDRCDVQLDGTGASEAPEVPPAIEPVAPPAPTGTTYTVGTLGGENFPDLATALAAANDGDRLLLSAQTFTVAATITVAKQVTIQGAGLASTVLQTAATGADPVTVIEVTADNVTIRDLTVKQRRTTNTSIEAAISINPPGGGAGATGHFIEAVRVETMEFGIVIRSDGWQINNCELAYVGPSNATRRLVATYRSNGQGLFCNSTFDSGQAPPVDTGTSTGANTATTFNDTSKSWTVNQFAGLTLTITGGIGATQTRTITANTATQLSVTPAWTTLPDATSTYSISVTGNTRVFNILTTTGLPTELTGGYLRLGNITPSNAYPVQQFMYCERFPAQPSLLTLYVDNCVADETSAFVVWTGNAANRSNLLSGFTSITFANNTLSGNHGGTPIGCKGMFAVDATVADAQPWGTTTFYASGNTIGNTTFRTGWQTIMSTAAPPGYGAAELALAGWSSLYFTGNPALEFPMALVPADPANAITGWRTTSRLRLDVCSCEGGDAGVLAFGIPSIESPRAKVDIDQSLFQNFGLLGIGCQDCDLAVTGGTRIEAPTVENTTLWGIICRQTVGEPPIPSTALINARITLPVNPQAGAAIGIDLEVDSGQITASRIEAESGIVSGNATGRGVAIGFNSVISQAGQQISAQLVDEVAHNILTT